MNPGFAWRRVAIAAALVGATCGAQAALFEDDEARRAILDLRTRVEAMRERSTEENAQLRRSVLELQTQIETMRGELQRMTGRNEELNKSLTDLQQKQKDVDERMKKNEPAKVSVDGREFTADPKEKADFDAALGIFRAGQFAQAQTAFADFVKRYPQSGFNPSALFWLGNAQYATRDYRGAIANFRALLQQAPDHPRAPEAVLSIANCQIELKDNAGAKRTLDELVKA